MKPLDVTGTGKVSRPSRAILARSRDAIARLRRRKALSEEAAQARAEKDRALFGTRGAWIPPTAGWLSPRGSEETE
jgi:hypothetical protein